MFKLSKSKIKITGKSAIVIDIFVTLGITYVIVFFLGEAMFKYPDYSIWFDMIRYIVGILGVGKVFFQIIILNVFSSKDFDGASRRTNAISRRNRGRI